MLTLANVSKSYGTRELFAEVSLFVARTDRYGLVGPNGAGNSTLFNLIQGHPNEYTPGRRPMHTLSPTLWTDNGRVNLVLGTRGGDQQPQFLAQFVAVHQLGGLCIDETQQFPRWNMEQPAPGTDSRITVESRFPTATVEALASMGHVVEKGLQWDPDYGPVSAIDLKSGPCASADPRISTSAALSVAPRQPL